MNKPNKDVYTGLTKNLFLIWFLQNVSNHAFCCTLLASLIQRDFGEKKKKIIRQFASCKRARMILAVSTINCKTKWNEDFIILSLAAKIQQTTSKLCLKWKRENNEKSSRSSRQRRWEMWLKLTPTLHGWSLIEKRCFFCTHVLPVELNTCVNGISSLS